MDQRIMQALLSLVEKMIKLFTLIYIDPQNIELICTQKCSYIPTYELCLNLPICRK